ncbi:MAG: serine/threonine protein kinase [Myxococcales bacterium]|nr:serine/threonine protein kinase [Myxococcales bacterium]
MCARVGEPPLREIDGVEPPAVHGVSAELFVNGERERGAEACEEAFVAHELRRDSGAGNASDGVVEGVLRASDSLGRAGERRGGLLGVADGACEIALSHLFVARADLAQGAQAVAVRFAHGLAMLHCAVVVDAGGAPIDRYVVLEHLSEGGMGAIYVGKKLGAGGFEMEVVLKQLLPEFTQQEEFIDLFLREAKLSATLDHANIVHTIDLVTAGGEYFIVMEYLPGGDLRTLLKKAKRRGKRFSPAAAIRICRETLSALAYAHVKRDFDGQPLKLIHRDVSPSNILVSYTGEVKLTDFGIAKASTHNSLFYKVKGKIGYMSPEQARSEPLDHRSDLYSLAVCMFEVITGERLFVHAGLTTSADEIYSQPVPSVSRKVPGLPAEFDAILKKALSINPDERYQTAGELNEALTRFAHRHGLLMNAPDLARELLDACGPTDQWRGDDDDDDLGYVEGKRAGTEVYDASDEDDEEHDDEDLGIGPVSIHSIAIARAKTPKSTVAPRRPVLPPPRPKTEVGKFAGVELTSIINMMDLEGSDGAKPLVDLNKGPTLDSGPRLIDSEASPLPPPQPRRTDPMAPVAPAPRPAGRTAPAPAPSGSGTRQATSGKRSKSKMPYLIVFLVLVAAGVAAAIVAMSGPDVEVKEK